MKTRTNRILLQDKASPAYFASLCASFLALCLLISYIESSIPLSFAPPGVKLGLANIVVVFTFFRFSRIYALCISFMRVLIMGLLFGGFSSFLFSFFGAALSFVVLIFLYSLFSKRVGYIGICVVCAAAHNIGQLLAACLITLSGAMVSYLPILMFCAVLTGIITGGLCIGVDRGVVKFLERRGRSFDGKK